MTAIQKLDYYQTLQLTRKASQQEIKQAYKRLALVHHPDKNQGTQDSKIKFRQISQAYTVLNDPAKRQNYDKYGVADIQGINFQQFMDSFGGFDEFLTEILSFNTFESMFTGMNKKKTKKNSIKTRGRAKGRQKGYSSSDKQILNLFMGGGGSEQESVLQKIIMDTILQQQGGDDQSNKLYQEQLMKILMGVNGKGDDINNDKGQEDSDQQEDQEDLTQQQMQILEYGQKNIQKKKVGNKKKKKTQTRCKLDGEKIQQDQVLMHFSEKHMEQFKKWQKQNGKTVGQVKKQTKEKQQQQEIQY